MGKHDKKTNMKYKKNQNIIIVILIITLIIFGFITYKFYAKELENSKEKGGMVLDTDATDKPIIENNDNKVSTGVSIPGWKSINASSNDNTAKVNFINPNENAEKYNLSFELVLNSTGETLYKSNLVEPGKTISKINLSKHLKPGTYDATVNVQPYRIEDNSKTNNAKISVKLIVN